MKRTELLFSAILLLISFSCVSQDENVFSADSLFNLGNSAYENGQLDEAIYYYERARLLDPRASDIAINLKLANEKLSTDIIEIEPFFLAQWWKSFNHLMLPGGWKLLSVLLVIVGLVLAYTYFIKGRVKNHKLILPLAGLLALLFILSILAGQSRYNEIFHSPFAIVSGGDQSLFEGPDLISEKVKVITGGNKLRLLDEDGEWYKVAAMDSEQGWVKKENVQLLRFE